MMEIILNVERCEETGFLVASWDEPNRQGGITTQGKDLRELQERVKEAVTCHFDEGKAPRTIRLHFLNDPVFVTA